MKRSPISECDIFVSAERKFSEKEKSEFLYNIYHAENYEMESLTADEVRELIACLQHALDTNEKGGTK